MDLAVPPKWIAIVQLSGRSNSPHKNQKEASTPALMLQIELSGVRWERHVFEALLGHRAKTKCRRGKAPTVDELLEREEASGVRCLSRVSQALFFRPRIHVEERHTLGT
jgi:hypothetical protein